MSEQAYGQRTTSMLRKAKARIGRLMGVSVEMYCQNAGCAVREVTLVVKEHPGTPLAPWMPALACPVCGVSLKPHHVYRQKVDGALRTLRARTDREYLA